MRRRGVHTLVAVLTAVTVLSACGRSTDTTTPDAPEGMLAPARRSGGLEVTIPALWADTRAGQSGIEPAKVWVNAQGSGKFSVDLNDIEAEGAGNSWRAASASAAVVGTMISGVSPAGVDINFAVTGPINGPSAGGILTVAVLAALLEAPLRADVTMTGTITADGSLGRIGGVELKLQAAAKAGYRTVLLPPSNMTVRRANGEEVSAVDVGAALGLEVVEVADIQKAFALFAARDFAYPELPPYQLPSSVLAAAEADTEAQIALIEADLAAASPGIRNDERLVSALADTIGARAGGDLARAYGLGVDTLLSVRRRVADEYVAELVATNGEVGAARVLRQRVAALEQRARAAIDTAVDEATVMGYEQMLSVLSALGWPVYAVAAMRVLDGELATMTSGGSLGEAARLLSDLETNLEVHFPHAMNVVRAMPSQPVVDEAAMASFLSVYGDFLFRAAEANTVYTREVLLSGVGLDEAARQQQHLSLLGIVAALGAEADIMQSEVGTLAQELNDVAWAFTYYLGVTSLVAAVQAFGIDDFRFANDRIYVTSPEALEASIRLSKFAVDEVAKFLAIQGLDAGAAVWSSQWGVAAYEALGERGREGAGGVLALEELWFDALNLFMIRSGPYARGS
jgi:hypothetical protein